MGKQAPDEKKPKFDPNKPYTAVETAGTKADVKAVTDKPKFDPTKPFTPVEPVKKKDASVSVSASASAGPGKPSEENSAENTLSRRVEQLNKVVKLEFDDWSTKRSAELQKMVKPDNSNYQEIVDQFNTEQEQKQKELTDTFNKFGQIYDNQFTRQKIQEQKQDFQQNRERNAIKSFGKSAWGTLYYDLPASYHGAKSLAYSSVKKFNEEVLDKVKPLEPSTSEKIVDYLEEGYKKIWGISDEQMAKPLDRPLLSTKEAELRVISQSIRKAIAESNAGAEYKKYLTNSLDKLEGGDAVDFLNYVMAAVGQATAQIPLSVATVGASSAVQEMGSIYMDGVQKLSEETGKSIEDIIRDGDDDVLAPVIYGLPAAALDRLGANKVMGSIGKEALMASVRNRALSILKAGGIEGFTEAAQTGLEKLGVSKAADQSWSDALGQFKESGTLKELADSWLQGFFGGGVVSGVTDAGSSFIKKNPQIPVKEKIDAVAPVIEKSLDAVADIENVDDVAKVTEEVKQAIDNPGETQVAEEISTPQTQMTDQVATTENTDENALQERSAEEVLQRQQEGTGIEGSERGGVEPVEQGGGVTQESGTGDTVLQNTEAQKEEKEIKSEPNTTSDEIIAKGRELQKEADEIKSDWFTKAGKFKKNTPAKIISRSKEIQDEFESLRQQYSDKKTTVDFTDRPFAKRQFDVGELIKQAESFYDKEGNPKSDVDVKDVQSNYDQRINIERQDYQEGRYGQVGSAIAETRFESAVDEINNEFNKFSIEKVDPLNETTKLNEADASSAVNEDTDEITTESIPQQQRDVTGNDLQNVSEQYNNPAQGNDSQAGGNIQTSVVENPVEGPTITPPPEVTQESEATQQPAPENRKFAQQILNDPNISDEVKKGLSEDAIKYIPKSMSISDTEAKAIIEAKGTEQALNDYLDRSNDMSPDTRVVLGENLLRKYNELGEYDNAVRVADNLAQYFTDLGRAVNAAKVFTMLTKEGVLRYVTKEVTKSKSAYSKRTSEQRKRAKSEVDDINKQAVEKILSDPKVRSKIISETKKESIKKAIDFLEGLKVDTKGKALDVTYGLAASAWNSLISAVQKGLQAGLTISQAINKAVGKVNDKNFDEAGARSFLDDKLKNYRVSLYPERAIKEELKAQQIKIEDIIRKHYSEVDDAKKSLVKKLMDDANLQEDQAQEIQKSLEQEFDRLTRAAKEKALRKYLPKKDAARKREGKRNELINDIIETSNMGAMTDEQYRDGISQNLGVESLSEQEAKRLTELADAVQKAKPGFDKNNASERLQNYIESLKKVSLIEAGMAIWYANILSGFSTQVLNISANFAETVGEVYTSAVMNPKQTGWIMKGLFNGWGRGLLEAMDTIQSGYQPTKFEQKIGASAVLERMTFKGGNWNPYNYLKYVARIMNAADIFFYQGINEMRARELAVEQAKREKKMNPDLSVINRAKDMIYSGANPFQDAREQAIAEGFTGRDQIRRAYEILEQQRPEFIIKNSNDEAARGTFNYDPEGTFGRITATVNKVAETSVYGLKPIKFIIPFTRIIANVLNRYLDWTPVGLLRAAKGGIGWSKDENYHRKYTPEERQEVFIRAITGLTAMVALYALSDDEDGVIEITADGTADIQKNFELQETGWRPYSVKVGDTWYEYKNTPLAIPMMMIGYMRDMEKYRGQKVQEKKIAIATQAIGKYILDMTFLKGVAGFFDSFSPSNPNGGETWAKTVVNTGKSFIVPNAFTQASRAMQDIFDAPMKKADGMFDQVIRDVPLLRDHLGNIYDALGDPVVPNQIERFIPLKPSGTSEVDQVWQLIADNNAWIGRPRRSTQKPNGASMTDAEYDKYCLLAGQLTKKKLQMSYRFLSRMKDKEAVKDEIDQLKADARREAREQLFGF